jgi:FG-GAP repeat
MLEIEVRVARPSRLCAIVFSVLAPISEALGPFLGDRKIDARDDLSPNGGGTGTGKSHLAIAIARSCIRSGQQGKKLVGTGAVGNARQGMSVALSADGNTAILGGWSDNSKTGAAWVFTRSGAVWTQQGKKLVGTDAVGGARQGTSVALSADGNTAIVGGPGDNPWDRSLPFGLGPAGAAWVFMDFARLE